MGKNRYLTYWSHSFYYICAASRPNQQNGMCAQRRLRSTWAFIRPVWSHSSLSTWRKLRSVTIIRAHSQASDQAARMPRLMWVFVGRKGHFVGFVMRRLVLLGLTCVSNTDFCYFEARKRGFLCIHARVCLSPFIMSYCRRVVILTFIFHDGRRVSLFI